MVFLVFQLQAPLASWGEPAVGEYRGSHGYPGESALLGLLGAALGLRREDEAAHAALRQGYSFAVGVQSIGKLLRDYHTAQVPGRTSLKGRPHATRRDELRVPKDELNTILSTRDYRQDAACLVAVQPSEEAPYALETLAEALKKPRFVLYFGRKSCPPAVPLCPQVIEALSALEAINVYRERLGRLCNEKIGHVVKLAWS
ncbi:MAG: type I-E CRISPR-associated protein Cas5/CasD, partial [Planctomycetes bacterium]|nr:type I-E CRISPR-associated protein Cas5/CasD [Planctomycetota bacterium]